VVVAGSSGLIGSALCAAYREDGHDVVRLVRRPTQAPDEVRWDPARLDPYSDPRPDPRLVDGADVVINLAGAPLGDRRWNAGYRDLIASSRIGTATALATMTARAAAPPRVLVSMSGIRYYGVDRGDEELTEASTPGTDGFLPRVTSQWEAATRPAAEAGVRVCHLRTALVLSATGGLVPRLVTPLRYGLGTTLGSGRAYWSFLTLHDTVAAIRFLAEHPRAEGPYNLSAPTPIRASDAEEFIAGVLEEHDLWSARTPIPDAALTRFGELVEQAARPIDDVRGTARYRRHALGVLARRTLTWAWEAYRCA